MQLNVYTNLFAVSGTALGSQQQQKQQQLPPQQMQISGRQWKPHWDVDFAEQTAAAAAAADQT